MRLKSIGFSTLIALASSTAHAEHFDFTFNLQGIVSNGGTQGCYYDPTIGGLTGPACPYYENLSGTLSFDTSGKNNGVYYSYNSTLFNIQDSIGFTSIDVFNNVPSSFDRVTVQNGDVISGTFSSPNGKSTFEFNGPTASWVYNFGYHGASGSLTGEITAVPEPSSVLLFLVTLGTLGVSRFIAGRKRV